MSGSLNSNPFKSYTEGTFHLMAQQTIVSRPRKGLLYKHRLNHPLSHLPSLPRHNFILNHEGFKLHHCIGSQVMEICCIRRTFLFGRVELGRVFYQWQHSSVADKSVQVNRELVPLAKIHQNSTRNLQKILVISRTGPGTCRSYQSVLKHSDIQIFF